MIFADKVLWLAIMGIGFVLSIIFTYYWIKAAKKTKLIVRDLNKPGNTLRPEMGGIAVVGAYIFSLLIYVGLKTFYFKTDANVLAIFAVTTTILIVAVIGLIDFILGWRKTFCINTIMNDRDFVFRYTSFYNTLFCIGS